jgi:hypothetical protein
VDMVHINQVYQTRMYVKHVQIIHFCKQRMQLVVLIVAIVYVDLALVITLIMVFASHA